MAQMLVRTEEKTYKITWNRHLNGGNFMWIMNNHPEWEIVDESGSWILIRDLALQYGCMSVTNGAEQVVAVLANKLESRTWNSESRKLYYIDTEGRVDEIIYAKKEIGFRTGFDNIEEFKKAKNIERIKEGMGYKHGIR